MTAASKPMARITRRLGAVLMVAVLGGVLVLLGGRATGMFDLVVVLSGSMQPALHPGDAVVLVERDSTVVQAGDVLAFDAPTRANQGGGTLTLHRVVAIEHEDGKRVARTRGDANGSIDRWPVPLDGSTEIAEVAWRIPHGGRVLLWTDGRWGRLALYMAAVLLVAGPAISWLRRSWNGPAEPARRPDTPDPSATPDEPLFTTPEDADDADHELGVTSLLAASDDRPR